MLETEGWTDRPFAYQRFGESDAARNAAASRPSPQPTKCRRRHAAIALVLRLPNQMIMLVGRDLGEPERFRAVVAQRADAGARHDGARRAG